MAGPARHVRASRMIIRNARAFLSRVSAVSRYRAMRFPLPREGTINITYYLDEDRDISVEVGDDELASSTNLDRDDLFLVWNRMMPSTAASGGFDPGTPFDPFLEFPVP